MIAAPEMLEVAQRLRAFMEAGDYTRTASSLEEVRGMRAALRAGFVAPRDWQRTFVDFGGRQLARGVLRFAPLAQQDFLPYADHSEWYRQGRRPAAFVTQPYNVDDDKLGEMDAWAKARGLLFSAPDYPSWHYPGWTRLCVLERAP